jgi:hypothetical protein
MEPRVVIHHSQHTKEPTILYLLPWMENKVMQSIKLDSQTTHGNAMVSKKQEKYSHISNLHGVEVFFNLKACKSCEGFNVEEENRTYLMIGSFDVGCFQIFFLVLWNLKNFSLLFYVHSVFY